jgi:3-mercaptopyruvate sulfurtransferase SseA
LTALLLIGCGASSAEPTAAPTAAPTATSEPTATPEPEAEIPSKSSEVPRMPVDEFKTRLDDGQEIVIVDTRSQASYDLKRIPGAIWVPSANLPSPLDDVPLDQEIVLYCT